MQGCFFRMYEGKYKSQHRPHHDRHKQHYQAESNARSKMVRGDIIVV